MGVDVHGPSYRVLLVYPTNASWGLYKKIKKKSAYSQFFGIL
jgi:hypothetical protein